LNCLPTDRPFFGVLAKPVKPIGLPELASLETLNPRTVTPSAINQISRLLTPVGKTSWEALISEEPTKIVEKLSVNSRGNRIYKNGIITPKKLISTPVDIALQTVKK